MTNNQRQLNKTTSIKVNGEKYDLIKSKGYNIQDLLDDKINEILGTENINDEITDPKKELENIDEKIDAAEVKVDKTKREYEKRIDDLQKTYDKELNLLKLESKRVIDNLNKNYYDLRYRKRLCLSMVNNPKNQSNNINTSNNSRFNELYNQALEEAKQKDRITETSMNLLKQIDEEKLMNFNDVKDMLVKEWNELRIKRYQQ